MCINVSEYGALRLLRNGTGTLSIRSAYDGIDPEGAKRTSKRMLCQATDTLRPAILCAPRQW